MQECDKVELDANFNAKETFLAQEGKFKDFKLLIGQFFTVIFILS